LHYTSYFILLKHHFQFLGIILKCSLFQIHPVRVDEEPKRKKESEAELLEHTNTFLPNKYEEHGNQTLFEKVILK